MLMEMYRVPIYNIVFCRAIASMGPSDDMDVKSKCELSKRKNRSHNFDFTQSHKVHEKPILVYALKMGGSPTSVRLL